VIFGFGEELPGGIRILTFKEQGVATRIQFDESFTKCCAKLNGIANATNDHSLRYFTVSLQHYSNKTFGQTGFRFWRLSL
jgi:hypothetical protein